MWSGFWSRVGSKRYRCNLEQSGIFKSTRHGPRPRARAHERFIALQHILLVVSYEGSTRGIWHKMFRPQYRKPEQVGEWSGHSTTASLDVWMMLHAIIVACLRSPFHNNPTPTNASITWTSPIMLILEEICPLSKNMCVP